MSVLCCRIPHFLTVLACRRQPAWTGRPLALVGPDDRIWAVSPAAQQDGVQAQMRPQQAQVYCPDVLLRDLDLDASQQAQADMLATAAQWDLPVEPLTWGALYVDLHLVGKSAASVRPLAAELGQRLRVTGGNALQPALGWDSGKFTAHAAAMQVMPGRVRLVDKVDEVRFLKPLPVTLLPLPPLHLQQLHWLGVRTVGQFAALPAAAVWQRFGAVGKRAHRWAQGKDDRPVRSAAPEEAGVTTVTLDPPTGLLAPVVAGVMASLHPTLAQWAKTLTGLRHLRLTLDFIANADQSLDLTFVEPASQSARVQAALVQHLTTLTWPGAVQAVRWQALATGELLAPQPTLFDLPDVRQDTPAVVSASLAGRYGDVLLRSQVVEPGHPIAERRSHFHALSAV
jgi:protein ImuB